MFFSSSLVPVFSMLTTHSIHSSSAPSSRLISNHSISTTPHSSSHHHSSPTSTNSSTSTHSHLSSPSLPIVEFGELKSPPSSIDLSRTLECPICTEVAFPPIWNCAQGHSICSHCRPKLLGGCGLCKAPFTSGRNYALEFLISVSTFACSYSTNGCPATVKGDKFRDHLKNCSFRPGAGTTMKPRRLSSSSNDSSINSASIYGDGDASDDLSRSSTSSPDHAFVSNFEVVSWVRKKSGQVCENGVVGGVLSNGESVYVVRAYHGSRPLIGRLLPYERNAVVVINGTCEKKWYYDVLVAIPELTSWVDASWGDVPLNAVSAGGRGGQEEVYVGRAFRENSYAPGYVSPSDEGCYVSIGSNTYLCPDYQVLVISSSL